jgi:hypothetical protein
VNEISKMGESETKEKVEGKTGCCRERKEKRYSKRHVKKTGDIDRSR